MPLAIENAGKRRVISTYQRPLFQTIRCFISPVLPAIRLIQDNIRIQHHGLIAEVIPSIHQLCHPRQFGGSLDMVDSIIFLRIIRIPRLIRLAIPYILRPGLRHGQQEGYT